jgi:5-methylcytosine-specific restriction endonuclease McrA
MRRPRPILALGVILWATLLVFTVGRWTLFATIPLVIAAGAPLLRRGTPGVEGRGPRTAPEWLRSKLIARDGGRCRYCGVVVHHGTDCPNAPIGCHLDYHADHVLAWDNDGSTVESNLVTSCEWCNLHKGTKDVTVFVAWLWSAEGRAALAERFATAAAKTRPRR